MGSGFQNDNLPSAEARGIAEFPQNSAHPELVKGDIIYMVRFPFLSNRTSQPIISDMSKQAQEEQHLLEREQFKAVLESFKSTRIKDRLFILDLFLSTEEHITLSGLQQMVKEKAPHLQDRAFLKETMEMFCQFGFALKRTFETQEALFEHNHLGMHHDHFICTRCGHIQEFHNQDLEHLQLAIARNFRFHPLQHKMEIYGLCSVCMEQRDSTIPLSYAANGERVQIEQINGGRELHTRLANMGLSVGICLKVINNNASGPCIVAIKDMRIAIDSGMAQKIIVSHSCSLQAKGDSQS